MTNNQNEQGGPGQDSAVRFDPNEMISTARSVITAPADYFKSMPRSGGFVNPLIFIIAMSLVAGIISGLLSFVASPVGMLGYGIAAIVVIPIGATIGAFIGAGILFLIWKLMGSTQNFEAAFRCLAAASAIYPIIAVLNLVPYLGTIVSVAWGAFLMIEASVQVHGRERRTAQMVFGILAVILIVLNVSAERAARNLSAEAERLSEILEQYQD